MMSSYMDADHALHFARVDFRNDRRVFGIKDEDRFLHVYIIGKTGTGKSTLIETMALQDLERGNGFALIDPHGDLVARVAARIPASKRDKVIYLDATDPTQPYGYNPLRDVTEDRIAMAASGMMDVFKKMWPDAWGVRATQSWATPGLSSHSGLGSKTPPISFANSTRGSRKLISFNCPTTASISSL
jgi:type IV secretory pathway TraG/TraD family ATPase VirD4